MRPAPFGDERHVANRCAAQIAIRAHSSFNWTYPINF